MCNENYATSCHVLSHMLQMLMMSCAQLSLGNQDVPENTYVLAIHAS